MRLARLLQSILLAAAFPLAASSSSAAEIITGCEASGNARPICIFQNPEDLAPLPAGKQLIVSEYGAMEGGRPGALALFDLESETRTELWRGGKPQEPSAGWGDNDCPGAPPASFSPHGIDLAKRPDGKLQLLVVQHGGRESVEFFEVFDRGRKTRVEWRGCAIAPSDAWLNEVVTHADGFFATHMAPRAQDTEAMQQEGGMSAATGSVYEWRPGSGYKKLALALPFPNGIEISDDGATLFINLTGGSAVLRVDRKTLETEAKADTGSLDNSTWAPDGRLLVASLMPTDLADFQVCGAIESGACPIPFQILAVDPKTMQTEVLYEGGGPPMGAGTVGLQLGNELFIGSFAGDRILRVQLAE